MKAKKFEFLEFDCLSDGEIELVCKAKIPENKATGYVPIYLFEIRRSSDKEVVGRIDIRIGFNESVYYIGNIGYIIDEKHRGHNYATKACRIIKQVALAHGMNSLLITTNPDNIPSRKTCEKIGAKLVEIVDVPPYNELYLRGERQKCIYRWELD